MADFQSFYDAAVADIPAIEQAAVKSFIKDYPEATAFTEMVHKISAYVTLELLRRYHEKMTS